MINKNSDISNVTFAPPFQVKYLQIFAHICASKYFQIFANVAKCSQMPPNMDKFQSNIIIIPVYSNTNKYEHDDQQICLNMPNKLNTNQKSPHNALNLIVKALLDEDTKHLYRLLYIYIYILFYNYRRFLVIQTIQLS